MAVHSWLDSLVGWEWGEIDSTPVYECQQCGRQFGREYHQCPACGGFRVERMKWRLDA